MNAPHPTDLDRRIVGASVEHESARLHVAGEHNLRNALAACAAANALAIPVDAMQQGLGEFPGVPGRLQRRRGPPGVPRDRR